MSIPKSFRKQTDIKIPIAEMSMDVRTTYILRINIAERGAPEIIANWRLFKEPFEECRLVWEDMGGLETKYPKFDGWSKDYLLVVMKNATLWPITDEEYEWRVKECRPMTEDERNFYHNGPII